MLTIGTFEQNYKAEVKDMTQANYLNILPTYTMRLNMNFSHVNQDWVRNRKVI